MTRTRETAPPALEPPHADRPTSRPARPKPPPLRTFRPQKSHSSTRHFARSAAISTSSTRPGNPGNRRVHAGRHDRWHDQRAHPRPEPQSHPRPTLEPHAPRPEPHGHRVALRPSSNCEFDRSRLGRLSSGVCRVRCCGRLTMRRCSTAARPLLGRCSAELAACPAWRPRTW